MPSGRVRRLLGGIGLGYVHTASTVVIGLWLTPYLLGQLGSHDYGLWLLGTQLVVYLGLLDLGVVAIVPRDVAAASGQSAGLRLECLRAVIGQTAHLVLWQLPAVAAVGIVVTWLLPPEWAPLRGPTLAIVVVFVVMFPCRIFVAVLEGLQDLAYVGATRLVSWAVGALATVAAVMAGAGLYALVAGWVTTQVLSAAMAWTRMRRVHPNVLPRRLPSLTAEVLRQRVGRGAWVGVEQVAQLLLSGTDLILIGKILGPQAVVVYACTGRLLTLLANQSHMLMQLALPALSELRASETRERLFQVSRSMMQLMFLIGGAIVVLVLVVNETFVDWWVGSGQFGGTGLTALLLAGMFLRQLRATAAYSLFCFGNERRLALTSVAEGLLALGAIAALLPIWGLHGAAMGSIIAVCLVGLPSHFVQLAREEGVSLASSLVPFRPWAIRLVVLLAFTAAMASLGLSVSPRLVVVAVAVACAYVCVMGPILSGDPLGPMVATHLGPRASLVLALGRRVDRLIRA